MKKTSKLRLVVLSAGFVVLCLAFLGGMSAVAAGASPDVTWEIGGWSDTYLTGETVEIPAATANVGGVSADAVATVIFPDGTATLSTSFVATIPGVHRVIYTAVAGEHTVREDRAFTVEAAIASSSGSKSTYRFGEVPLAPSETGLNVSLAPGEILTFQQIIDVSDVTKDDTLVEFFVAPSANGAYDCEQFYIVLTDVEDPTNVLTFYGRASEEGIHHDVVYCLAKGDGQSYSGWNYIYSVVDHSLYGTIANFSMYGYWGGVYQPIYSSIDTFCFSYDAATKGVYADGILVTDLDDPTYVNDAIWRGFTSGKVRLSVYCKGYAAERANLVFTNIKDCDLSAACIEDRDAPEMTLGDARIYDAVMGGSYPVRDAAATDAFTGIANVRVSVSYQYPENPLWVVSVPVENGRFRTNRAGTYTVRYTATDAFGNEVSFTDTVVCRPLDATERMTADFADTPPTTVKRGGIFKLPGVTTEKAFGEVLSTALCIHDGRMEEVTGETYTVLDGGVYTFRYVVRDDVGQIVTLSFDVTAVEDEQPVFRDEPELPAYFISGFRYLLPTLRAYRYKNGIEEAITAAVTIKDAGGERLAEGGAVIPAVNENGDTVELIWRAGGTELRRTVKTVQLISNTRIMLENLFLTEGLTGDLTDDGLTLTADASDGSFLFANTLIADGFTLGLRSEIRSPAFDGLYIRLTDAGDSSKSVTVRVMREGSRSRLYISGKTYLSTSGFDRVSDSGAFSFKYYQGGLSLGSLHMDVTEYDDGSVFAGFPSQTVRFTCGFIGAESGARLTITEIAKQPIYRISADRIKPEIKILGDSGGEILFGSSATVPPAIARDVLNPMCYVLVTVTSPSGAPVVAEDGTVLYRVDASETYRFRVSEYGRYNFEYSSYDTLSGRTATYTYVQTSPDNIPPEAEFVTSPITSLGVGDVIVVPAIKAHDAITADDDLVVIRVIVAPDGSRYVLTGQSNSLRPAQTGDYIVSVLVMDELGNTRELRYTVTVH